MKDRDKTKAQLINELSELRRRIAQLQESEGGYAEEALRESEARLKSILDSVQAGILIIDAETHLIVDVNPAAAKMIGAAKELITGSVCHNFICPAEIKQCPITDLGQSVDNSERILLKATGESLPILKTAVPVILDGRKHLLESFIDITELKQAEEELRESSEQLRTITGAAMDAIVMMDNEGNISFWNPAAEQIFGYTAEEAIGKELHTFLGPPRYHKAYIKGLKKFRETGEGPAVGKTLELSALRKGGTEFPIELSLSAIRIKGQWHAAGIIRDITWRKQEEEEFNEQLEELVQERTAELKAANERLLQEITERRRAEKALLKSEKFLNTIFDSIYDPLSIIDRDYRIVRVNEAYAEMKNKPVEALIGKKCYEVLRNRNSVCEECIVEKTFNSGDPCAKDKCLTVGGLQEWVEIYTYPISDEKGTVSHVIEYTRDITERKKTEDERRRLIQKFGQLSRTDSLTGLSNRRALVDKLNYEFTRAERYGSNLSLILCDIDYLKKINDTYGHAAGDEVLKALSRILRKSLRRTDIVGRYGGDEFMLILPETPITGAQDIAERIRYSVENTTIKLQEDKSVGLSLSLGVVGFTSAMKDIDALIKCADTALYRSKQAGRNKIHTLDYETLQIQEAKETGEEKIIYSTP